MAEFNVTPQAQPPANYTGASQGIQASPNTALGTLFSGIAEAVDTGVKEADRHTQEVIREEIFAESDKVLDEFGVGDATSFQEDAEGGTPRPQQLAMAGENLDRLQLAYEKGALKESHYWARMNSVVRQLRQRYPGYRAEIDDMVSSITGGKPANQLRNALFSEWNATKGETPREKLVDWAMKNGHLPPDYFDRENSQAPYTDTELQARISNRTATLQDIQNVRAQNGLAIEQGTMNTANIEKAFRREAHTAVQEIISDTTSALGASYEQLQSRIAEARTSAIAGAAESPVELLQMAAQLEQDLTLMLNQKFTEQWDADPTHSYVSQLDKKQKDDAIASAMVPIQLIKQALASDDPFALMGAVTTEMTARKELVDREILDSINGIEEISAMTRAVGPEIAGLVLDAGGAEGLTALIKSVYNWSAARAANKLRDGSSASIADTLGKIAEVGGKQTDYNAVIAQWQGIANQVTAGDVPLEVVQSYVQFMFGPESQQVLAAMNDASKFEYYKKVSSPQVTKQMLALRDNGDQDSWDTYQAWTVDNFRVLFQQSVQELQNMNTAGNLEGLNVRWDDKSNGFVIQSEGFFGLPGIQAEASQLNTAIRTLAPIIEANGGDVSKELAIMFEQMGFDPAEARAAPSGMQGRDPVKNLAEGLFGALLNGLTSGTVKPGDPNYAPLQ